MGALVILRFLNGEAPSRRLTGQLRNGTPFPRENVTAPVVKVPVKVALDVLSALLAPQTAVQ